MKRFSREREQVSPSSCLFCLNFNNGELKWSGVGRLIKLSASLETIETSSPLTLQALLIRTRGSEKSQSIYAFMEQLVRRLTFKKDIKVPTLAQSSERCTNPR